jgi:hypothetical protein
MQEHNEMTKDKVTIITQRYMTLNRENEAKWNISKWINFSPALILKFKDLIIRNF